MSLDGPYREERGQELAMQTGATGWAFHFASCTTGFGDGARNSNGTLF